MKRDIIVVLICALILVGDVGTYVLSRGMFKDATETYKAAVEVQRSNDARLSQIGADQVQALKLLINIDKKLEPRIGDGPQTGDAPK
jgi:hypothetical protein